jgi:predicted Zn-dependent peptidase
VSTHLFAPSSAYAYPADGTPESVAAIDRAAVRRFHAAHYHPAGATLVVVGDVNPTSLAPLLDQHLGAWTPVSRAPAAVPAPMPRQPAPRTLLVDLPAGPHAQISVATVLPLANEADRGSARLLQRDLSSQIHRALDTRRLAYDATVSLAEAGRPVLQILVFVPPARAGEAIEVIHQVLRQRGSALQLPTFRRSRERLIDDLAEAGSTNTGLESILVDGVIEGVADSFVAARLRSLEAPTPEDVRSLAARAFAPARLLTVVVGDRSLLEPVLRKSGPVSVVASPITCSPATPSR